MALWTDPVGFISSLGRDTSACQTVAAGAVAGVGGHLALADVVWRVPSFLTSLDDWLTLALWVAIWLARDRRGWLGARAVIGALSAPFLVVPAGLWLGALTPVMATVLALVHRPRGNRLLGGLPVRRWSRSLGLRSCCVGRQSWP